MEGVGLICARRMISLPSLIPPIIPPAWLEVLEIMPSFVQTVVVFGTGKTCHVDAVTDLNSFYSTNGHDRMSEGSIQLVKTVSPRPAGTFLMRHSITPPALS